MVHGHYGAAFSYFCIFFPLISASAIVPHNSLEKRANASQQNLAFACLVWPIEIRAHEWGASGADLVALPSGGGHPFSAA